MSIEKKESEAIPSASLCFHYHEDFGMLANIQEHSKQVARVAASLFDLLAELPNSTMLASRELVIAGALLHDIAKTECLKSGCKHAEIGADICRDLGYPHIAEIVAEHVLLPSFASSHYQQGEIAASGLVYYADKRVLHDQIVSLDERLDYIIERYGKGDPHIIAGIQKNFATCYSLESQLFCQLSISPEQIKEYANRIKFISEEL